MNGWSDDLTGLLGLDREEIANDAMSDAICAAYENGRVGIDAKAGDLKVGDEILVGHGYWTIRDVETGLMNPDTGGLTGTVYLLFTRTLGDETESGWDEVAEDCSVVVRR